MYDGKFGLYPDSKNESLKSPVFAIRKIHLEVVCRVHGRDPRLGHWEAGEEAGAIFQARFNRACT